MKFTPTTNKRAENQLRKIINNSLSNLLMADRAQVERFCVQHAVAQVATQMKGSSFHPKSLQMGNNSHMPHFGDNKFYIFIQQFFIFIQLFFYCHKRLTSSASATPGCLSLAGTPAGDWLAPLCHIVIATNCNKIRHH